MKHALVAGNSLCGDGILPTDAVVIEPSGKLINDKVYLIKVGGRPAFRHVQTKADKVYLDDSGPLDPSEVTVMARVTTLLRRM
jgi:hypothetical protein